MAAVHAIIVLSDLTNVLCLTAHCEFSNYGAIRNMKEYPAELCEVEGDCSWSQAVWSVGLSVLS